MLTYLWCFFAFSFLGWCAEVVFAALRERRFVNRGFLNGPFCPIYGFGVVLMDFLLRPFGGNLAVLLVGSMLVGSGLEWVVGFLWRRSFNQKWWDYSDQPHNLNGYVCLKFSLVWAVAGAVIVRFIMPFFHRLAAHIPHTVSVAALAVLGALLLADFVVTVVAIVGLNRKLKNLEYVTGKLRAGSDQLGSDLAAGAMALHDRREAAEKDWQREAAPAEGEVREEPGGQPLPPAAVKGLPGPDLLKAQRAAGGAAAASEPAAAPVFPGHAQAQRGRHRRLRVQAAPGGGAALRLWAVLQQAVLDLHDRQRGGLPAGDRLRPGRAAPQI